MGIPCNYDVGHIPCSSGTGLFGNGRLFQPSGVGATNKSRRNACNQDVGTQDRRSKPLSGEPRVGSDPAGRGTRMLKLARFHSFLASISSLCVCKNQVPGSSRTPYLENREARHRRTSSKRSPQSCRTSCACCMAQTAGCRSS